MRDPRPEGPRPVRTLSPSESGLVATLRGGAGKLSPGRPVGQARADVQASHRRRLIAGLTEVAAARGYDRTSVADVVANAEVSRRTFYEHFQDKDACFLAAYEASTWLFVDAIERVAAAAPQTPDRTAIAVDACVALLVGAPAVSRLFFVDVLAVGRPALEHRRAAAERLGGALGRSGPSAHLAVAATLTESVLLLLETDDLPAGSAALRRLAREALLDAATIRDRVA